MTRDLRLALTIGICAVVLTNLLAAMGLAGSLIGTFKAIAQSKAYVIVLGMTLGPLFLMHVLSTRIGRDAIVVITLGAGFTSLLWFGMSPSARAQATALYMANVPAAGFGLASLLHLIWHAFVSQTSHRPRARHLLLIAAYIALMVLGVGDILRVAAALQPKTLDFITYRIDAALGFQPSTVLSQLVLENLWLDATLSVSYAAIAYAFPVLYGLQLRNAGAPAVSVLRVWVVGMVIAYATYLLYPITGPYYAFGQKLFPMAMPGVEQIPLVSTIVSLAPRNGMPSMHFGWALLFWMNLAFLDAPKARAFARPLGAIFVILTGLATIGLGEHYLVDLVVAIPFVVGVQALCATRISWSVPARKKAALYGFGIAYCWILTLRVAPELFIDVPGLLWLGIIATLVASVRLYRPFEAECLSAAAPEPIQTEKSGTGAAFSASEAQGTIPRIVIMFVLSGLAGIMYEVLFSKALALTFGSTATATYTVLATYMGGMAIGSWLGGRLATSKTHPLLMYAACELAIGIYCVATPAIFKGIQHLYVTVAAGVAPDAQVLTVFRLTLGVAALLAPTIAMGMTLPILARFFSNKESSLGRSVAALYAANTIGAALGALVAGYFVLPILGVYRTTLMAAALNLIAALIAIELLKQILARSDGKSAEEGVGAEVAVATPGQGMEPSAWLGRLALLILGVGGIVTLAVEIKYMHLLAVVAGNSTYAFSLMLFTFLVGLGCGAEVARRLLHRRISLPLLLGALEFGLAAVILGGVFLWNAMPGYFGNFQIYPSLPGFGSRELARGIVCWMAMFPPALLIGALYPIAMECVGRSQPANRFRALGTAASLNTIGNIAGVLLGGFILLPYFGALRSVQILAVLCIVLGGAAMWRARNASHFVRWLPALPAIALLLLQPASFDYDRLASGTNVYFRPQSWGKIIDHAESIDGGLTSVSVSDGNTPVRTLLTNGKFQGNDSVHGEMQAQIGFALAPLLHTERRNRALVIGYGTGVSTRTLHAADFEQLDVVDLSSDIIRLANKHFAGINDKVTEKPGVNTYVTDGRNFLMLQNRRYDVIGMEISSIWFAGAASLYNREFYHLVKQRLNEGGVLQQWMQLHHVSNHDVLTILASVRAEFRYVWLYLIGGQGIIVASNDAAAHPSVTRVNVLKQTANLAPLLDLLSAGPETLLDMQLLDPGGIDRLVNSIGLPLDTLVSTDDNLWLEYSTPKGNVLDTAKSVEANLEFIRRFSSVPSRAETDPTQRSKGG